MLASVSRECDAMLVLAAGPSHSCDEPSHELSGQTDRARYPPVTRQHTSSPRSAQGEYTQSMANAVANTVKGDGGRVQIRREGA